MRDASVADLIFALNTRRFQLHVSNVYYEYMQGRWRESDLPPARIRTDFRHSRSSLQLWRASGTVFQ
jgi:hypothetical protein